MVRLPRLSRTIPGASDVHYYSISGRAPIDLIRQMERKGNRSCDADALACVYLKPNVTWSTATNPTTKACVVTGTQSSLEANVYLPRWTKPARVYRGVVRWWRDVLDHIAWHEGRHIAIEQRWIAKLEARLPGQSCARARTIARNWLEDVAAAQHAFDARDRKAWTYPGYDGPGGFFGD